MAVALIVLFFSMNGVSSQTILVENNPVGCNGTTLYVGGTGPNNYTRIQDAVDNASNGDTVFVYNGTYSHYFEENWACVRIDKRIRLLGENRDNTIINGSMIDHPIIG